MLFDVPPTRSVTEDVRRHDAIVRDLPRPRRRGDRRLRPAARGGVGRRAVHRDRAGPRTRGADRQAVELARARGQARRGRAVGRRRRTPGRDPGGRGGARTSSARRPRPSTTARAWCGPVTPATVSTAAATSCAGWPPTRTRPPRSRSSRRAATGCGSCRSSTGCPAASTVWSCRTAPRCSGPSSSRSCAAPAAASCSAGRAPPGTHLRPTARRCGRLARDVGEHLRESAGYRGAFGIDGILGRDGFRPTELNSRLPAGLATQARRLDPTLIQLDPAQPARGPGPGRGRRVPRVLGGAGARRRPLRTSGRGVAPASGRGPARRTCRMGGRGRRLRPRAERRRDGMDGVDRPQPGRHLRPARHARPTASTASGSPTSTSR